MTFSLRTIFKILDKYAPMKKKVFEGKPCHFDDQKRTKMNNQGMIIENNAITVLRLFAGQNSNTFLVLI